jgi:spermidine/putrescine transport system substrate-binding protein
VNTRVESEIEAAGQALIDQKPLVLAYLGDPVKDKMISENAALAVVYSGDAAYCMMENENLDYIVPKEGSNLWFDNMVIMKESQSVEAAHLFIDFLCRDDVALQNTEYIGYTTPVQNAYDNVPEELKNNAYMPREEDIENCEIFHDLGDTLEIYNKIWIKVKSVAG